MSRGAGTFGSSRRFVSQAHRRFLYSLSFSMQTVWNGRRTQCANLDVTIYMSKYIEERTPLDRLRLPVASLQRLCTRFVALTLRRWSSFVHASPKNEPAVCQYSLTILITSSRIDPPGLLPFVVVLMERIGAWLLSV